MHLPSLNPNQYVSGDRLTITSKAVNAEILSAAYKYTAAAMPSWARNSLKSTESNDTNQARDKVVLGLYAEAYELADAVISNANTYHAVNDGVPSAFQDAVTLVIDALHLRPTEDEYRDKFIQNYIRHQLSLLSLDDRIAEVLPDITKENAITKKLAADLARNKIVTTARAVRKKQRTAEIAAATAARKRLTNSSRAPTSAPT